MSVELDRTLALLGGLGRHRRDRPFSLAEHRRELEALADGFDLPGDVTVLQIQAGGVPALQVEVGPDPPGVMLYLHGGGYSRGSARSHLELAARLARAGDCRVLVLDYRLAPEHPFPAAVDDALEAYRWLLDQPGVRPDRLVVAGDSAGGGLAVAVLVAVRGQRLAQPAAVVCLSPWVDLDLDLVALEARQQRVADPLISPDMLVGAAERYLAGAPARHPLASPVHADLTGLPPLLIEVGADELLAPDSHRLAEVANQAGVPVELRPAEGLFHVWPVWANLPEAHQATDRIGRFVRRAVGGDAPADPDGPGAAVGSRSSITDRPAARR
jgi:epsilon-lactone hydrolase